MAFSSAYHAKKATATTCVLFGSSCDGITSHCQDAQHQMLPSGFSSSRRTFENKRHIRSITSALGSSAKTKHRLMLCHPSRQPVDPKSVTKAALDSILSDAVSFLFFQEKCQLFFNSVSCLCCLCVLSCRSGQSKESDPPSECV